MHVTRPQERFKTIFSNYFETAQTNRLSNYFQVIELETFAAKAKQIIVASVNQQRKTDLNDILLTNPLYVFFMKHRMNRLGEMKQRNPHSIFYS